MEITNNKLEGFIEATVDGENCSLTYKTTEKQFQIISVNVPKKVGGRGIAGELVKYALEYAKYLGLKVLPICSYAKAYIDRHAEYNELL